MAKTIKCSNCGAVDLTRTGEGEYRCNYCQAKIVTDQPKFDFGSFFKTFNPNDLHQRTQTTYHAGQVVKTNTSRLGCLMGLIILLGAGSGIVVPIVMAVRESTIESENQTWKLSYTTQAYFTSGTKGPVVWHFQEEQFDWKKNRTVLSIIDPVKKKKLKQEIVVPEHTSSDKVASFWDLYNGGRVFGDTIFFTPKGKGLEGYNIYTGKKVLDQSYFEKNIGSELAEASAYTSSNDPYLRIKSAEGVEYYYFPNKKILTRDEYYQTGNKEKKYRWFYELAGNTDKKYVLRINQLASENDRSASFHHSYSDYKKEKNYYSKYYNINSIDSIPVNHGFFKADFISYDRTSFVIIYKANLLETAPWVIARFDTSGQNLWKVIPTQLPVFKPAEPEQKVEININKVNNSIIVLGSGRVRAACGINPNNGKVEWTYKIDK